MIPYRTPSILPWIYPSLVWRMEEAGKNLFLTFDDGPVPGPTEFVLEEMAKHCIKATFFCIGDNIRKYPRIFTSIIAHGHTVGNHTVNHMNGWKTSTVDYLSNVRAFDPIAAKAGLQAPAALFRPPYGCITRSQIKALSDYRIVMWDVLSQDYRHTLPPEHCLKQTIRACRPGSVIVFHDSYKAQRNMEFTVPRLIDHFGGLGYGFKAIPSLSTESMDNA